MKGQKWGPMKKKAKIESLIVFFYPKEFKQPSIGLMTLISWIYSFILAREDTGDTTLNSVWSVPALVFVYGPT